MPVQKMTKCPVCHGVGSTPTGKPCKRCGGTGEVNALSKKGKRVIHRDTSSVRHTPAA